MVYLPTCGGFFMVSVGKYTMDGSYGILKGQMDSSTTNGILKDSSTTKEPFAFGRLPCHSQIVRHAFDHHLMFREKRLRGQPLPSGARNLEDTGARTKSPLSGAGHPRNRKSKPHRWESATLVTSRWKKVSPPKGGVFCLKGGSWFLCNPSILPVKEMSQLM